MAEGPNPGPSRRGRRDPEIQAALALETETLMDDTGAPTGDVDYSLVDGDVIMAKVSHEVTIDGKTSWYSLGAQSRVLPGETGEDAWQRVVGYVNTGVVDMVVDGLERLDEATPAIESVVASRRTARRR